MGLFVHEPSEAWSVEPTAGVPESDGADTVAGNAGDGVVAAEGTGGGDSDWPEAEVGEVAPPPCAVVVAG